MLMCALAAGSLAQAPKSTLAEPRRHTHVACSGDSITAGVGASSAETRYVARLQDALGEQVDVQNFGLSGRTMLSAPFGDRPYRDAPVFDRATQFVNSAPGDAQVSEVIMLGTNDSKPFNWRNEDGTTDAERYLEDYRAMVDHFESLDSKLVLYLVKPIATTDEPCCEISGEVIAAE